MIRNFGTMAQQIPLLTRMPAALRKEIMPFVAFVLDATQKLLPSMREATYRYVLGDAVHAFLSFYETISNSEAAAYFGEKLIACCMKFFSSHTETAKEVFNDRSDVINALLQKLPPGNLNAQMMQELLHETDMEVDLNYDSNC
ncbi:hypothetical protein TELCIR_05223 [Teladorsagia circumcincta]|uniref:Exportin-1 C-terminal domain-containing protein n=1 Tax=Teladorsagia circumcincta TaxID=45464 RepID=A0A2G9URB4_TELCI|nr:hypothetical protein TELCIR_05223 [Teladorsagia circumcincta]